MTSYDTPADAEKTADICVKSLDSNELGGIIACAEEIRQKLGQLERANRGRVHFRPAESGVTMVGLLPGRPQRGRGGYSTDALLRVFADEFQKRCVDVPQGRPTPEKELQSFLIADAYRHDRSMAALASANGDRDNLSNVRFVTDEISINNGNVRVVCDLLAVRSLDTGHCPVLIELKSSRQMTRLIEQVEGFTVALDRYSAQFEELFSAVLGEEITFASRPERWIVWPGNCSGSDRLATELREQRIGVIQYKQDQDSGFSFHIGPHPTDLAEIRSPPGKEQTQPPAESTDAANDSSLFGPQYSRDTPFAARMRFHQSWYRATVLHVPWGVGPKASSEREIGNMLCREAGASGRNFLTESICDTALSRIREQHGAVDEYRLLHNMLSSQPMCFNLFGPLIGDLDLATRVLQHVLPGAVRQVLEVQIEYAPAPAREFLNDRTAFDAFIEYERMDGSLAFLGIETKLVEPFSQKHYDRPEYRRWVVRPDSPWPEGSWSQLDSVPHNQLWRDHLLAVALHNHSESKYTDGQLMLIAPRDDEACWSAAREYQRLLRTNDTSFLDLTLDSFVDLIAAGIESPDEVTWLADFRRRYINLHESEVAWKRMSNGNRDPND